MSEKDPSTVKDPAIKRMRVANYSREKMRKIVFGLAPSIGDRPDGELRKMVTLKEKTDKTKVNSSQLENLPNEILLKIFNYMNPKIEDLLVYGHVSRRIRSVAHDQSLWQNVNLFRPAYLELNFTHKKLPTGLLQLILENGCKRLHLCGKIVGTLTLNQESQLKFLTTAWNNDPTILAVILASCQSLVQLNLRNVILAQEMTSSIYLLSKWSDIKSVETVSLLQN